MLAPLSLSFLATHRDPIAGGEMMRRSTKTPAILSPAPAPAAEELEIRPCGMLVQKRTPDSEAAVSAAAPPPATVRIKVKHAGAYHDIYLSSQATFGEVKKLAAERAGLHHRDLKVVFKDKERDAAAFLDIAGVKDGSKMAVMEDPVAQAKRLLEARRQAKLDHAVKSLAAVTREVDRLAAKVTALDAIVSKGGKVVDNDLLSLIELLMNELIKLDGVIGDGETKKLKEMQVKRVQKYVETLDMIKIKNAKNGLPRSNGQTDRHPPRYQQHRHQQQPPAVVTTTWETFDSVTTSVAGSTPSSASSAASLGGGPTPRFDWELL